MVRSMALAVAVLAALGTGAVMLVAGSGPVTFLVTALLAAVQVALLARVRDVLVPLRRFLLAWSGQAGLTYAVAGAPTVESALVFLGVGLVFAAVLLGVLALTRRLDASDDVSVPDDELGEGPDDGSGGGRGDEGSPGDGRRPGGGLGGGTQPLPVADGD
ncbi:hypothetical protein ACR9E3_23820 [Actinomycetospora sp. C-140]